MSVNYLAGEPEQREKRDLKSAIKRGLLGKCPNCGTGKLFRAFVKPVDQCAVCNENYTPQRADDLPAYLVITVVGHIVLAGFLATEMLTNWDGWLHLAIWAPVTVIMSMALLQPIKGAVIGLQWANHMHGFGGEDDNSVSQI
jgi:uncharacterized protein (DUF983 family)